MKNSFLQAIHDGYSKYYEHFGEYITILEEAKVALNEFIGSNVASIEYDAKGISLNIENNIIIRVLNNGIQRYVGGILYFRPCDSLDVIIKEIEQALSDYGTISIIECAKFKLRG